MVHGILKPACSSHKTFILSKKVFSLLFNTEVNSFPKQLKIFSFDPLGSVNILGVFKIYCTLRIIFLTVF